jgi:site-specific DNA-adenine methylase
MSKTGLKAPFPYFGGKSRIASEVWKRLGNVDNYVEPFGGSLAVLLARPEHHEWWSKKESAGDYSGMIVNVFRAIKDYPEEVASHANWPITEADLTARHLYLLKYEDSLTQKLLADPKYSDPEAAGWWIWGVSAWVGGDWMTGKGPYKGNHDGPGGVFRKLPMMAGNHSGKGIHKVPRKVNPDSEGGLIEASYQEMTSIFTHLSNRLRRVRLSCGDWTRLTKSVVTPSANKVTGIFLDPPYDPSQRRSLLYGKTDTASNTVHDQSREWALENGYRSELRIAYCSYSSTVEDELFRKYGWTPLRWQASGGYGLQSENSRANSNRSREIIWFSPNCLPE